MRAASLLLALALLALVARAQDAPGAYFGLAYGNLHYKNVNEEEGIGSFSRTSDQRRLIGGYRFNDRFAVEASWAEATGIDNGLVWKGYGGPYGGIVVRDSISVDAEMRTRSVRAIGIIPYKHLSLFGGAGYYDAALHGDYRKSSLIHDLWIDVVTEKAEGPYPLSALPEEFDHRSLAGATLAGGLQYDFDKGPSLRLETEYFFTPSDVKLKSFNLHALYRLGHRLHPGSRR